KPCVTTPKSAILNFTLKEAGGKDFDLSAQKCKVVILGFWATWCPPCKVEIPWFIEFQSKYGPKDFTVIGVSVDDSMAKLKPFADRYKMHYPVLVGDGCDDIKGAYGGGWGLPTTLFCGHDGRICQ